MLRVVNIGKYISEIIENIVHTQRGGDQTHTLIYDRIRSSLNVTSNTKISEPKFNHNFIQRIMYTFSNRLQN